MKEYRVKKGLRLLVNILASLVILFYGGLTIAIIVPPFNTFTEEMQQSMPGWWVPVLLITMIVLMILVIISIKKRKVIITDESIISISLLSRRELKFNEIKNFNVFKNPKAPVEHIGISPLNSSKKMINISNLFENSEEIKAILSSKAVDLDAEKKKALLEKIEKEHQEILANNDFGFTVEEREGKLKKTRLFANILNGITAVVMVWLFFYPRPYKYALIACVSLPFIGFLAVKFWKGLIRIDAEKGSVHPTVAFPVIFPGIILFLRVLLDFSIDDYSNIWMPAILISVIFAGFMIAVEKKKPLKKAIYYFSIIGFAVFGFIYGYSAVVATNCVFDNSVPKVFSTTIVNKQVSGSKYTSYDLYLSPWGKKTEIEKISIDSDMYNNLNNGDKVSVYQFKGRFDIPWVVVGYGDK
ncbi:hypothetical protein [Flavobacterium sp. HTF]|uniref:hypothetical protein n=1 Tax=Flavobacterium sp. HTF TaxID=2170732 RepID=UPI000D5F6C9A|nr:hypothetical protein [Flavobacterium sp. HTF]PWB28383.1 hypothetical protein DCO46_00290 [Flavobacterium sp. HTF]